MSSIFPTKFLLLIFFGIAFLGQNICSGNFASGIKFANQKSSFIKSIQKRELASNSIPSSVDREWPSKDDRLQIRVRVVEPTTKSSFWTNGKSQACPQDNIQILINGVNCPLAIDSLGHYLCYKYEKQFRSCCEKCMQVKNPYKTGCEYGDHNNLCKTMEAYLCYERHNREICCETCPRFKELTNSQGNGCEYGDMTPHCKFIKPSMCYREDIQRLCCHTCPILRNQQSPACPYGDRDGFLCATIRLDRSRCYQEQTRQICCNACNRLKLSIPGCTFGDHRVAFNTPIGAFGCEKFIRIYGQGKCKNPTIKSRCCASCYGYI